MNRYLLSRHIETCKERIKEGKCKDCPFQTLIVKEFPEFKELFVEMYRKVED